MNQRHLLWPKGFRAAGVYAGIKSRPKPDVGLLVCDRTAAAAVLFTENLVVAAPVTVGRRHIKGGRLRGVVVNSGNANACTGKRGEKDAIRMCNLAAEGVDCAAKLILPSSTGIIGHMLPMAKVQRGIVDAAGKLGTSANHAGQFADAIMTTDLVRKTAEARFTIDRQEVRLAGVCKGSGMIGPRLGPIPKHATMLAYLTTDAQIAPPLLQKLLAWASEKSFNALTVDDHASTNDTVCLLASGLGEGRIDSPAAAKLFSAALNEVCQSLARQIAADGEGAEKIVTIQITGARSDGAAKAIARAIAVSPLVKCAMHGNDPNWGRIVSAAGMAGVPFDPERCELKLAGTVVFRAGQPARFNAVGVSRAMAKKEVIVELDCRMGKDRATFWTCDLSKQYVTINADYHT
jgi:glutamate N-acetyltransferase/amino-acid N-acetyltransferase